MDEFTLPIHVRRSYGQYTDPSFDTDSAVVLAPQQSVTSLYDGYTEQTNDPETRISLNTFPKLMCAELTHIRVSLRTWVI